MILVDSLIIFFIISIFFRFSRKNRLASFYFYLILLTSVAGTMYEGGYGDYASYCYDFNNLKIGIIPSKEIGFYILNVIIKIFTSDFNIAFYIYILIINIFILKVIYKYSSNIELSILIYIMLGGYITAINITRQFISLAIYTYSISYLLEKKYIKYTIWAIISLSFHQSVFIAIIISLLIKVLSQNLYKHLLIYFLIASSLIFIEQTARSLGINLLYPGYSDGSFNYGSSILHYIVQLSLVLFYLITRHSNIDESNKYFINMTIPALSFTLLSQRMVLYSRFSLYFSIYHILAVTNIISTKTIKIKMFYSLAIFVFIIGYYILLDRNRLVSINNHILDYLNWTAANKIIK